MADILSSPMNAAFIESDPRYSAPSAMAVEYEVAAFLYALVRITKPSVVLETGCGEGNSTHALFRGIDDNGCGRLHTCDTNPVHYQKLRDCLQTSSSILKRPFPTTKADQILDAHLCAGIQLAEIVSAVDLAFLDSSGDRVEECSRLNLRPGGIVVLHDSNRKNVRDAIALLRPWKAIWDIPTPRGLTVFQS
jgi:predicted O-methyltransferase YrrM